MPKEMRSKNIIWTIDGICRYLDISRALFYRLVKYHKLPATVIEGKYCAHAENLERFFRDGTKTPPKNPDAPAE